MVGVVGLVVGVVGRGLLNLYVLWYVVALIDIYIRKSIQGLPRFKGYYDKLINKASDEGER